MPSDRPAYDRAFRTQLADWLETNGIPPGSLPPDGRITLQDGLAGRLITVERYATNADGQLVTADDSGQLARTVSTVPMTVEPHSAVAQWLDDQATPLEALAAAARALDGDLAVVKAGGREHRGRRHDGWAYRQGQLLCGCGKPLHTLADEPELEDDAPA